MAWNERDINRNDDIHFWQLGVITPGVGWKAFAHSTDDDDSMYSRLSFYCYRDVFTATWSYSESLGV
jgi:hypothetical protein